MRLSPRVGRVAPQKQVAGRSAGHKRADPAKNRIAVQLIYFWSLQLFYSLATTYGTDIALGEIVVLRESAQSVSAPDRWYCALAAAGHHRRY